MTDNNYVDSYSDGYTRQSNTIINGKHDYLYYISSRGVRDNILLIFEAQFSNDPRLSDILKHFSQFDSKILDQYNEICIVLELYNSKITFKTSRVEYSKIVYTLTDWNSKPCKEFRRKKFMGIF